MNIGKKVKIILECNEYNGGLVSKKDKSSRSKIPAGTEGIIKASIGHIKLIEFQEFENAWILSSNLEEI